MRELIKKSPQLCGCTKSEQSKLSTELLRMYTEDGGSLYNAKSNRGMLERFQPLIWLLYRNGGKPEMIYSIAYKLAEKEAGSSIIQQLAESKFKENFNKLSSSKKKSFLASLEEKTGEEEK